VQHIRGSATIFFNVDADYWFISISVTASHHRRQHSYSSKRLQRKRLQKKKTPEEKAPEEKYSRGKRLQKKKPFELV
jgi:hypothetical protein